VTSEILSRLRIIASMLQSQTGSPESILERTLSATTSLIQWIEAQPVLLTDDIIDDAALMAAVEDVLGIVEE